MSLLVLLLACFESPTSPPVDVDVSSTAPLLEVRTTAQPETAPASGPNVVLLLGCTLRRDQIDAYGANLGVTPTLSAMAAAGTRFTDPIAAAAWTRAASAAIVSGRHPLEVGLVAPDSRRNDRPLQDDVVTLAERFQAAGYRTVGATANPNLSAVFGFDQGFEAYVQPRRLWREDATKVGAADVLPKVFESVGQASERPVFLQVMLVDAHSPFPAASPEGSPEVPVEVRRYREALRRFDAGLASLMGSLESRGFTDDNTVFAVVSDHGEGLKWPEHHGISHGRYLYSSAVEAVWVMKGAGIPSGHTVSGPVSMTDVGATLLGLANVSSAVPGLDRSRWVRGETLQPPAVDVVSDSWFRGSNRAALYTRDLVCMRSFLTDRPEPEAPTGRFVPGCYDRESDPLQLTPLDPLPEAGERVLQRLTAWRAARPVGDAVPSAPVSKDLNAQLEALGYVAD